MTPTEAQGGPLYSQLRADLQWPVLERKPALSNAGSRQEAASCAGETQAPAVEVAQNAMWIEGPTQHTAQPSATLNHHAGLGIHAARVCRSSPNQ